MAKQKQLDLSKFDYANLKGQSFKEYQEVFGSLLLNDKYDFEEWLATSEVEKEFDKRTGAVVDVMAGIKLQGNKPIAITRISIRHAMELNKYVSHMTTDRSNSKYYLLAKEQKGTKPAAKDEPKPETV